MIAQALLGSGWAFFSGASEAWIAGEIGEEGAARAIVRGRQTNLSCLIAGGFVGPDWRRSGSTFRSSRRARHRLHSVCLCSLRCRRRGFVRGVHASRTAALTATFYGGARAIRGNRILLVLLAAAFLTGMASEGLDRLWEAHLYADYGLPGLGGISKLYWFAIIGGIATALSVGALRIARRFVERESDRALAATAMLMTLLVAVGCGVFGLASGFAIAVGAYWVVRIGRNVLEPTYMVWMVRHSDPAVRATVISMEGQSHSIGEIVSGPAVGIVGRLVSIPGRARHVGDHPGVGLAFPSARSGTRARRHTECVY